jgi:hypothetical protein
MKKPKGVPHKAVKSEDEKKRHPVTIKFTTAELKTIHSRARSMELCRAEYLRSRGLKPIGRLRESQKKEHETIALTREMYEVCLKLHTELQIQGRNINQIARGVNSIRLAGGEVPDYSSSLDRIRAANLEIGQSIARLGER